MFTEAAPAKINLALHVTGRRPDGYHLLDSLVVFAGAHDRLTAEPAAGLSLTLGGPFAGDLTVEPDNLVLRAACALAAWYHVEPAAAALRLLSSLWGLSPTPGDLHLIAAGLGADVPVCLDPKPRRMAGIGEILAAAPSLPDCGIVLVNPGIGLATASVFRARSGAFSPMLTLPPEWTDVARMAESLSLLENDLELPARTLCPELDTVLSALRHQQSCGLARMSGSGATCFGLFPTAAQAAAAAAALARPGWWCWGGPLWRQTPPLYVAAPDT